MPRTSPSIRPRWRSSIICALALISSCRDSLAEPGQRPFPPEIFPQGPIASPIQIAPTPVQIAPTPIAAVLAPRLHDPLLLQIYQTGGAEVEGSLRKAHYFFGQPVADRAKVLKLIKLIVTSPKYRSNQAILLQSALICEAAGHYQEAADIYQILAELGPDSDALNEMLSRTSRAIKRED